MNRTETRIRIGVTLAAMFGIVTLFCVPEDSAPKNKRDDGAPKQTIPVPAEDIPGDRAIKDANAKSAGPHHGLF